MNKGEIWIVELPFKNGREQRGKRPCIILGDSKIGMIITIPLTSNLQALRFPYTVEIKKSVQNGLEADSIALVFQIQSLDQRRFKNKIGTLEKSYIDKISSMVKELMEL